MKLKILICFLFLSGCTSYNINIAGVPVNNFKGRDWKKITIGAISSFMVHEAGHLLYAKANGGGHYNFGEVIMENYYNESHGTQQMFHRSGFLSQLFIGKLLTVIPETKHSDFAIGFNSFTTTHIAVYTITGGNNKENSDIEQLDNGVLEGSLYTLCSGVLTLENLREEKK
jgi:hypothetical protein